MKTIETLQPPPTAGENAHPCGKVYLVGAGPGDPELITVKGLRCLRTADVVLYDRLISLDLLDEAPSGAKLVYVGKQSGCHAMPQTDSWACKRSPSSHNAL